MESHPHYGKKIIATLLILGGVGAIGYLIYLNNKLTKEKQVLGDELTKTQQDFASTSENLMVSIDALKEFLTTIQGDKRAAEENLMKQKDALDAMSGTLDTYQKIVSTDRELLEKYSRIFFLNENYTPKSLTVIPTSYTYGPEKMISSDVWPFLQILLDDANTRAVDLKVTSAYRSFDTQSTLKSTYKVTYGSGANKFSADQGYSEHQLGTTVDFTTSILGGENSSFAKTASYTWLMENAYKYGFILSYPKGNTYYIFEPWHWRFVGKNLALTLHNSNKNFIDLPQRELDTYLVSLFDK